MPFQVEYNAVHASLVREFSIGGLGMSAARDDGVEVATGSVQDFQTKLLRPDGEAIDTGGAPAFAFGIETEPEYERFNPLTLVEGRMARPAAAEGEEAPEAES